MSQINQSIHKGHFAKKQILCKDWLISWSHQRRFEIGLELVRQSSVERVLDYGSGDGTFLAMLMEQAGAPQEAVGAELDPNVIEDCRNRFGQHSPLKFIHISELDSPDHYGKYDLVTCMEVLEHVVDLEAVLGQLDSLLAPAGKLLVSVPVEIGAPLLVKQMIRRIAGWRGLGQYSYTSSYSLNEYLAGVFAGHRQHFTRPVYGVEEGFPYHDHKGFNWMVLRDLLAERFQLERVLSSPLKWSTPHLASQAWFLASKKHQ